MMLSDIATIFTPTGMLMALKMLLRAMRHDAR